MKKHFVGDVRSMFGKKKMNMESKVVVKTKEELKAAVKRKELCIEVQGDLANKMKWMGKISKKKIAALIALLATAAFNPLAAGSAVAIQGVVGATEAGSAMAFIILVGAATIIAIYKGYDIGITINPVRIILTKK